MLPDTPKTPDELYLKTVKATAEGATNAILSKFDVKGWIKKFKQKDLAFIGDEENIKLVEEQRKSFEVGYYSAYIKDENLRTLVQLGLTLRKLELVKGGSGRISHLRDVIVMKYYPKGLHVAQFVQNGILGKYITSQLSNTNSTKEMTNRLESFLNHIDKFCIFIKFEDQINLRAQEIITRIQSLKPPTFIIYASGKAVEKAEEIIVKIESSILDYELEEYFQENKKIVFFNLIKT